MKRHLTVVAVLAALWCFTTERAPAATLTNWARGGVATQSTTYNDNAIASRAIDGNTAGTWGDTSTTHTADSENDPGANPWWQVDLQESRPIGHVHFWFREDCCFDRNDFLRFVIYDSTNTATRVVLWETNNAAWYGAVPRDLGFNVSPPVNGRVLYVEHMPEQTTSRYVCLTEAEVFNQNLVSGANYALQGMASSSSCYQGDCGLYGAQQAVDGAHHDIAAVSPWGFSAPDASTEIDPMPWWQLDLASAQTVGSVVIWPRRDQTYAVYKDIKLSVLDASNGKLYEQVFTVQPSGPKFVVNFVPPLAGAKVVRIETTAETPNKFLTLPEVEVFAPQAGTPALTFTTDLQPVTVEQNREAKIGPVVVSVDGGIRPEDISYRWFKNGTEIPNMAGSWLAAYTTPGLVVLADNGEKYKVQASVAGTGIFSSEVTLNVVADTTAPTVVSNTVEVTDRVLVAIVFSEMMDAASATNTANYALAGGPTVGELKLSADSKTVTLTVQNVLLGDSLSLTVSGVKDLAGNNVVPATIMADIPQTPINYARGGTATQNSSYTGATVASRAIDGNTAGSWGANSLSCTANGELGWWEVDLKSTLTMGTVRVWWRSDCCGTRNQNIDLVVYDKADPATRVELLRVPFTGGTVPPNPTTLDFAGGRSGQVVRLEHTPETGTSDPSDVQMCLAEVQIFPPPTGLVVTPAPSSWNVYAGDRIFLRSGSTGQTPIATKWQRNGVDIPGATAPELVITNITPEQAGSYVFVASNAVRVRESKVATVVVNPRPPLAQSLVARYLFTADTAEVATDDAPLGPAKTVMHDGVNTGGIWVDSLADSKNLTRTGVMQFDATIPSQVSIAPHADLNSPVGTIAFWIKTLPPVGKTGLFDRRGGTNAWGDVLVLHQDSADSPNKIPDTIFNQAYPSGLNVGGTTAVDDDNWRHIAYVYTWKPFGIVSFYVDGKLDAELTHGDPGEWPLDMPLEFGRSHDSYWPPYTGYMDDIHIFNRTLDAAEINQLMTGGVPALPPALGISLTGSALTITWPDPGYILQQNTDVSSAAGWADIANATTGTYTTTAPTTGNNYYRLKKQ